MHQRLANSLQRAERVLVERLEPAITRMVCTFDVASTAASLEIVSYAEATARPVSPIALGAAWGQAWTTTWFRLRATVPNDASLRMFPLVAVVDLGFAGRGVGFQVEGTVYRDDRVLTAVQPDRRRVHLTDVAPGSELELWVEAAATPNLTDERGSLTYAETLLGDPRTAPLEALYVLRDAHLAVLDPALEVLAVRWAAVIDLARDLADTNPMRARLFDALEHAVAEIGRNPGAGAAAAAAALDAALAAGAAPGSHRIVAVGHSHLDTAWLWPLRETRRKAVRTFANAVELMGRHRGFRFAASQAQQYATVEADQPAIFAEVARLVAEGRWEPVGGMWVEVDLNLAGAESLVRQFVHGQRAFQHWFGVRCEVAFLPDDFGYPACVPQLARLAGCAGFFTQKLSWNQTNRFPHHTFWWEGMDGSEVFTHFSPIETYNALMTPSQLRFASRNFADHAGATTSLACFGHGDGGGGPTDAMLHRIEFARDLQEVPAVSMGSVRGFFRDAEAEYGDRAPRWVGEIYLEKHRGTLTSQLGTKQGNRRSERWLHEAELWSVATCSWPAAELDALWKRTLTQQFHDILPGSSIAWVHAEAECEHAEVARCCTAIVGAALGGDADVVVNPAPVARHEVAFDAAGEPVVVRADAFSVSAELGGVAPAGPVCLERLDDGGLRCTNGLVGLRWDRVGRLVSFVHCATQRELLPAGREGCGLVLLADAPGEYDAWEVEEPDTRTCRPVEPCGWEVMADGPLAARVSVDRRHGASRFPLSFTVRSGSSRVDVRLDAEWQERDTRLQMVMPVDVHAHEATCGTQFGHVRRPRHANTGWDAARFEVCAHRYVHAGEPGFGVAILVDGARGWDVRGDALRLSLLRSPRYPDPGADRGRQVVEWSVWAHEGDAFDAGLEQEAHLQAHPARIVTGGRPVVAPVVADVPGVLVCAVKRAEDGSGDLIVRMWETRGARTAGRLTVGASLGSVAGAHTTNLLEDPLEELGVDGAQIALRLRPFQILTVRVAFDDPGPGG